MKYLSLVILCLAACVFGDQTSSGPTAAPPTLEPGWQVIAPGLELRRDGPSANPLGRLLILRVDPNRYAFRVHYLPQQPQSLDGWRETLPAAVVIVNAGFFTPEHLAIGLLVANGVAYGEALQGRGGSFVVRGGQPRILSNVYEPDLGDRLEQVIQAYPLLIYSGQALYGATPQERASRRTLIAQDGEGRVLLMATPLLGLSLDSLTQFLLNSDLGIVDALNLDGGGSTLLYVQTDRDPLLLPSLDPVPAVLAVYPG